MLFVSIFFMNYQKSIGYEKTNSNANIRHNQFYKMEAQYTCKIHEILFFEKNGSIVILICSKGFLKGEKKDPLWYHLKLCSTSFWPYKVNSYKLFQRKPVKLWIEPRKKKNSKQLFIVLSRKTTGLLLKWSKWLILLLNVSFS